MTVCDGYFIGGEVIRNKRSPQWGAAPIEDAEVQRPLQGCWTTIERTESNPAGLTKRKATP